MLKPAYEVNYNTLKLSSVVEICNSGKSTLKLSYFSVEYSGSDFNLFFLWGEIASRNVTYRSNIISAWF